MVAKRLTKVYLLVFLTNFSQSFATERDSEEYGESYEIGGTCDDQQSSDYCRSMLESGSCKDALEDSPLRNNCQRSCGFCSDSYEYSESESEEARHVDTRSNLNDGSSCEDKIPNCSGYIAMCCSMKEAMNTSCAKTCKFCTETPATPPSNVGGGSVPGGVAAPTASTGQDPCSPTDPPSVTVDAPAAPGGTTTTQSALTPATIPGVSLDPNLPGQTTTTTQSSIPGSGNVPGNPVG